jgi:hypothetical protein
MRMRYQNRKGRRLHAKNAEAFFNTAQRQTNVYKQCSFFAPNAGAITLATASEHTNFKSHSIIILQNSKQRNKNKTKNSYKSNER